MAGAAHWSARLPLYSSLLKVGSVDDLFDGSGEGTDDLSKVSQRSGSNEARVGAHSMTTEKGLVVCSDLVNEGTATACFLGLSSQCLLYTPL